MKTHRRSIVLGLSVVLATGALAVLATEVPGTTAASTIAAGATLPESSVPIELRVIDETGRPLGGVAIKIESEGPTRTQRGTLLGEHLLKLREGAYQLTFSHPDTYDVVLSGFEIDLPEDSERRKTALEPLRVMMQRRRGIETDVQGTNKRRVAAPELAISFGPRGRPSSQRPAVGVITLRNTGAGSVQLPRERASLWTPESLTMHLTVKIGGMSVALDEFFLCLPSDTCQELAPGQAIEWPVALNDARSYSAGKSEPTTWPRAGSFGGKVGVELILPQGSAETSSTTRPVESTFTVEVLPE